MADRIFPNKFQESGLDSELVFTGINWDTFNERLAAVKDGEGDKKVPHELLDALNDKYPEEFDEEAESNDKEGGSKYAAYDERDYMNDKMEHNTEDMGYCPDCGEWIGDDEHCEDCGYGMEDEDDEDEEAEMEKRASKIVFNNPSQLSAEAVEAAIAAGDTRFANTILAARHERRVRLATQIESNIKTAQAHQTALNQRKAFRENLVKVASKNETRTAVAQKSVKPTFVKASALNNNAKKAFAAKAVAAGFPAEYVEAMLNTPVAESPKVAEIKQVMASNLNNNIKKQVVASIVKEASLDAANINRCKDYWKNELGYGDPEWVDELFDSKN